MPVLQVMRLAMREIKLLKASQHHNVVQLMEAFRSRSGRVYIVMVRAYSQASSIHLHKPATKGSKRSKQQETPVLHTRA
jgi:cyclin-dependent kinase-like